MRPAKTTFLLLISAFPAIAQSGAANGEWRTYGGDIGNTRYSALDQINAGNFNKLTPAWTFHTENLGPQPEYNFESTPLMVGGVMYTTAGTRRDVVALSAKTGELLWMHREDEGERGDNAPRKLSGRGLSYWSAGRNGDDRILYVTPGYRLIALNAKTGIPVTTFGTNGAVDLKLDDDQEMDLIKADIGLHSTPLVAGDTVVVGAAHLVSVVPKSKKNVKGYVRGFDVRTGKRLWIFHTIPRSTEFGYNTWEHDAAEFTGNTGVWAEISADLDLGLAYLPVELPTGDYYGGNRPGDGLFGESIVAVDLKTGKRKWHYQLVHHGIWDMDIPCAPILTDITINGRTVKALAQPTKQSMLYVLNRETGQPIWPIEERPVPQSDIPGEKTSATQPFPTKPLAYGRNGLSVNDLIDFTPGLHDAALKIVEKFRIGPVYTPAVVSKAEGPLAVLAIGLPTGGSNWPGGAYDPETHLLYVYSKDQVGSLSVIPADPKVSDFGYRVGMVRSEFGNFTVQGLPIIKPPYGTISAIDMNKGEIVWQIAHGDTPDNIRNHPALKGITIPRTGRAGIIGTLVTKTLVIAGEPGADAKLRAYDKATGKEVGAVAMPAGQTGSPMTYSLDGKQYITVAVSGTGVPGQLVTYALGNQ